MDEKFLEVDHLERYAVEWRYTTAPDDEKLDLTSFTTHLQELQEIVEAEVRRL